MARAKSRRKLMCRPESVRRASCCSQRFCDKATSRMNEWRGSDWITAKRELTQVWCKTGDRFDRLEKSVVPIRLDHAAFGHAFKRPIAEVEEKMRLRQD